jgi:protein tyrosine phosphatase (PTP) superfamily phosphohydrolase (DUF442 family)
MDRRSMLSEIYNYRQIGPTLATSGQPDEQELAAIAAAGYEVVLNIALHDDARYSLPDEEGAVRALGMRYLHIPVLFDAPTLRDFDRFCQAMEDNSGAKLWVHCAANKRVSAFLGLYWHIRKGMPLAEAFALQREIWDLDEVWSRFIDQILSVRRA